MGAQDLHGVPAHIGPRCGRGRERAHERDDLVRGALPVDGKIRLTQRPGDARLAALRSRGYRPFGGTLDRLGEKVRSDDRQPVVKLAVRLAGRDLDALLQHDRARVHAGVHQHDADARFGVAVCDRALNRRCAAIARQQRRMDVQRAQTRDGDQRRG